MKGLAGNALPPKVLKVTAPHSHLSLWALPPSVIERGLVTGRSTDASLSRSVQTEDPPVGFPPASHLEIHHLQAPLRWLSRATKSPAGLSSDTVRLVTVGKVFYSLKVRSKGQALLCSRHRAADTVGHLLPPQPAKCTHLHCPRRRSAAPGTVLYVLTCSSALGRSYCAAET